MARRPGLTSSVALRHAAGRTGMLPPTRRERRVGVSLAGWVEAGANGAAAVCFAGANGCGRANGDPATCEPAMGDVASGIALRVACVGLAAGALDGNCTELGQPVESVDLRPGTATGSEGRNLFIGGGICKPAKIRASWESRNGMQGDARGESRIRGGDFRKRLRTAAGLRKICRDGEKSQRKSHVC